MKRKDKEQEEIKLFLKKEINQETPTDIILKKIVYLDKIHVLKKLFDEKRLVVDNELWTDIDNKSRLRRLFTRYEKYYYTDPSQTFFSKIRRKMTSLPSQKEITLLGTLYTKEQALERKCIRLIKKIYKHVKNNEVNLPDGVKYYRDTNILYIPKTQSSSNMMRTLLRFLPKVNKISLLVSFIPSMENRLTYLRTLYRQLSEMELNKFAQTDIFSNKKKMI